MRLQVIVIVLVLTILLFLSTRATSQTTDNTTIPISQNSQVEPRPSIVSIQEEENNFLGLVYSAAKIEEAKILINDKNYADAEKTLKEVNDWLISATELHYNLHKVFTTQKNKITESKIEKAHALDFGKLRDESYLLLAQVYILQNKIKEAVPLLAEIIKSQIGKPLGEEAYNLLQTIKFSDKL